MSGESIALRKIQNRQSEQRSVVPDFNSKHPYPQNGGNKMFLDLVKSGSYDLAAKSLNNVNNVSIKDTENGNNVLHYIATQSGGYIKNSSQNLLNVLESNIQNLSNSKNHNGDTPLHIAAQNGNDQLVHYFKQHGADLNIQNGNGKRVRLSDDSNFKGGVVPPSETKITINEKELQDIQDSLNKIAKDVENKFGNVSRSFSDTITSSKTFANINKKWDQWQPSEKKNEFMKKLDEIQRKVSQKLGRKSELEMEVGKLRERLEDLKEDAVKRRSRLVEQFDLENKLNDLEQQLHGTVQRLSPAVQQIQQEAQRLQNEVLMNVSDSRKQQIKNEVDNLKNRLNSMNEAIPPQVMQELNSLEQQLRGSLRQLNPEIEKAKNKLEMLKNEVSVYLTDDRKRQIKSELINLKNQVINLPASRQLIEQIQSLESQVSGRAGDVNSELQSLEERVAELMRQHPEIKNNLNDISNRIRMTQNQLRQKLEQLSPQATELQRRLSVSGGETERLSSSSDKFLKKLQNVINMSGHEKQLGGKNINGSRKLYFTMDSLNQSELERPYDEEGQEYHRKTEQKLKDMGLSDEDVKVIKAVLWKRAKENNKGKSNLDKSMSMYESASEESVNEIKGSKDFKDTQRNIEQHLKEKADRPPRSPEHPKKERRPKKGSESPKEPEKTEEEPKKKKAVKKKKSAAKKKKSTED